MLNVNPTVYQSDRDLGVGEPIVVKPGNVELASNVNDRAYSRIGAAGQGKSYPGIGIEAPVTNLLGNCPVISSLDVCANGKVGGILRKQSLRKRGFIGWRTLKIEVERSGQSERNGAKGFVEHEPWWKLGRGGIPGGNAPQCPIGGVDQPSLRLLLGDGQDPHVARAGVPIVWHHGLPGFLICRYE